MSDLPPPRTPPGWYPDGVPGRERRWDGDHWTDETRSAEVASSPAAAVVPDVSVVRGITGYAELDGAVLLFRQKLDRPPLQRIDLYTVAELVVSSRRHVFDVQFVGSRRRSRPSLFSETSLQRNPLSSEAEWEAFLQRLERAIETAAPKRKPADGRFS